MIALAEIGDTAPSALVQVAVAPPGPLAAAKPTATTAPGTGPITVTVALPPAHAARPASVRVAYTDLDGKRQEIEADGLLATCIQHEIDHLNGVLFIDHLSRLKRERVTKRFAKQARREG